MRPTRGRTGPFIRRLSCIATDFSLTRKAHRASGGVPVRMARLRSPCKRRKIRHVRVFVTSLAAMLVTCACVSTRESAPVGADASTALTRCILTEAQTVAPRLISLDSAARAVIAACSFQVQAQRSALLAKSAGYGPQVRAELDKLERDHLELAKEQVVLNRGR